MTCGHTSFPPFRQLPGRIAWLVLALLVAAPLAQAASRAEIRKQIESSMLVRGQLDIDRSGNVTAVSIDPANKLPGGIATFVHDAIMAWKFEPVMRNGQPVPARAPVTVRLVAKKQDQDNYEVAIRNADFSGDGHDKSGRSVSSRKMTPPRYPEAAYKSGIAGDVYLLLKIGRQGQVEDVVAEQVNLRVLGNEAEMRRARQLLANASLDAARGWQFVPPTQGAGVDAPFWSVRVPVSFRLNSDSRTGNESGVWEAYIPGPRTPAPWRGKGKEADFSPDALGGEGGIYMADRSDLPQLRTPLQGG